MTEQQKTAEPILDWFPNEQGEYTVTVDEKPICSLKRKKEAKWLINNVREFLTEYAEQVASLRTEQLQNENAILRQGMVDAFNAGKNADEWDQMCGWIQHYTYAEWVTRWRRLNNVEPEPPKI